MKFTEKLAKQFHKEDPQQLKRELSWLLALVSQRKWSIVLIGLLGLAGVGMSLVSSVVSKYLIDAITLQDMTVLCRCAVSMGVLLGASLLLQAVSSRIGAVIHIRAKNSLQQRLYGKILRAGWEDLAVFRTGDLLNRLNADASAVSDGTIHFLPSFLTALLKFVGAFGIILWFDPVMALLALASAPVILFVSRFLLRKMRKYDLEMKTRSGELVSLQEDTLRSMTGVKAFSASSLFENKMESALHSMEEAYLSHQKLQISVTSGLSAMSMAVSGICLGWGVYQLWNGTITFGSMTLFLQLVSVLRSGFSSILSSVHRLVSLMTSAGRILAVEALPEENLRIPEGFAQEEKLDIHMEQVSFRYQNGETVLYPFDFYAGQDDRIAVVGTSGEGKTTLLRLLLGLVQPCGGCMYLQGESGTRYDISAGTRGAFAYVPQENSIFPGTVADNLRLAKPEATDEELEAVLKVACAWEFVSTLPGQLEYSVSSNGRGLSEGQAQRIAIARALLRKPSILLLDEATSGLDITTERKLLANLKESERLRTLIFVTHRPESASMCNRAYEISNGLVREVSHGN